MDWENRLYFGDNLDILRRQVPGSSVDLIYLDPPFNSNATYNVLFKKDLAQGLLSGPAVFRAFPTAQITAFEDTWQWGLESEAVYKEILTSGPPEAVKCCSVRDMLEAGSCAQKLAKSTGQTSRPEESRS